MEYVLTFLVFLGAALLTFGAFALLRRRGARQVHRRLEEMDSASTPELILGDLTPALASHLPVSQQDQAELQRELRAAGYYRPTALMEYAALRATFILAPLLIAGVLSLYADTLVQAAWIWGGGVLAAILGYSLPRVYVYYRGQARMRRIERALPTAIDMLILCLGAGLNVLNSLQRVTQELHRAFPILAYEFEIVRRQAELRTLEFALTQFADRVGLPQARNLTIVLSQSENLGTDAVPVLREFADDMRINMRQRADEMANKAPFKLLFPAYLMAFGAAILLIGPVVLEFSRFREQPDLREISTQGREAAKSFDPNQRATPRNDRRGNKAPKKNDKAREVGEKQVIIP